MRKTYEWALGLGMILVGACGESEVGDLAQGGVQLNGLHAAPRSVAR